MAESEGRRSAKLLAKVALFCTSLALCFGIIEIGYRILDPFPFFPQSEFTSSEHGKLTQYDSTLGWRGAVADDTWFTTSNSRVLLQHNAHGHRDIEHDTTNTDRPAIVFLGDSFTWGYEVEFDDMFVNRLRGPFPDYEIFNLAHRGYGTDQSLLTFEAFETPHEIVRVVLMFSENDIADNNANLRYQKSKPKFELEGGRLRLTGIPVPRQDTWSETASTDTAKSDGQGEIETPSAWSRFRRWMLRSNFLNDLDFRVQLAQRDPGVMPAGVIDGARADLDLTIALLSRLERIVRARGARLSVVFIPSKVEIEELADWRPYQRAVAERCEEVGIETFDLAPALEAAWMRSYFRRGMHWNRNGHRVAAQALQRYLSTVVADKDQLSAQAEGSAGGTSAGLSR